VHSGFTDESGTFIMSKERDTEDPAVRSATLKTGVSRVTLFGLPHVAGIAAEIFREVGGRSINIDDIISTTAKAGGNVVVSFTVDTLQADMALEVAEAIAERYSQTTVEVTRNLSRLRIVGMGMRSQSGVAARVFGVIAAEGVNVENISTSEIVISILTPEDEGPRALQAVHKAFDLEHESLNSDAS
jgi:aspartate kinase